MKAKREQKQQSNSAIRVNQHSVLIRRIAPHRFGCLGAFSVTSDKCNIFLRAKIKCKERLSDFNRIVYYTMLY